MKSEGLQSYIRTLTVMPALVSTGMFAGAYSYDTDTALRRLLFPALSPKSVAQYIVDGIIYDREVSLYSWLFVLSFSVDQLMIVSLHTGGDASITSRHGIPFFATITRRLGR